MLFYPFEKSAIPNFYIFVNRTVVLILKNVMKE